MKQKEHIPKASYGYGGKFGVEKDRMDKVNKLYFLKIITWRSAPLM